MRPLGQRGVLVVLSAFFVALGGAAALIGVLPADAAVREALLEWSSPATIGLMRVANYGGDWRVLFPGTLMLFALFRRARDRWWLWVGLMIVAPAMEGLLKLVVGRARPEDASFGFPSGHATAAAAFFGAVLYLSGSLAPSSRRLVRALAVAGMILVGLARIVLRAHWPSDVLGGLTLGLGLATVAALLASFDEDADRRMARPAPTIASK
jgi:undecaprenyl-diphosphatase